MWNQEQTCTDCYQRITNPICERCHTNQLQLWMSDHDVDKAIIDSITSKIRERYPGENLNNMPCIICGTETVSTCTYCFFFKIENILMSLNIPEEMIMHFLQIFNYKLYHEVFTKEED